MLINIFDAWKEAKLKHKNYLMKKIEKYLNTPNPKDSSRHTAPLVKWLKPYLLSHKHNSMRCAISKVNKQNRHLTKCEMAKIHADFEKIFDYENFKTKTVGWDAYDLCGLATSKACPYCNYQYLKVVLTDDGSYRFPLDHFYPQHKHPFLALSLANLIPSCTTCNSSLKKSADFYETPHLHPLFDTESISFRCEKPGMTILDIISNFDNIKNDLEINLKHPPLCIKTKNSLKTFVIKTSYKSFNNEALSFIYSKTSLENSPGILELFAQGPQLPGTPLLLNGAAKETADRLLRFDRDDYKNQPLGKMFADLYDQFDRNTLFR